MMQTEPREIIGIDLGMKRTGIARASTTARLPEALVTVPTEKTIDTIKSVTAGKEIEAVVIGLPRNLSGNDTEQTKWVRKWVKNAKNEVEADFFWQDEALTSHFAKKTSDESNIDAQAAALILHDFLDTPADKRVIC